MEGSEPKQQKLQTEQLSTDVPPKDDTKKDSVESNNETDQAMKKRRMDDSGESSVKIASMHLQPAVDARDDTTQAVEQGLSSDPATDMTLTLNFNAPKITGDNPSHSTPSRAQKDKKLTEPPAESPNEKKDNRNPTSGKTLLALLEDSSETSHNTKPNALPDFPLDATAVPEIDLYCARKIIPTLLKQPVSWALRGDASAEKLNQSHSAKCLAAAFSLGCAQPLLTLKNRLLVRGPGSDGMSIISEIRRALRILHKNSSSEENNDPIVNDVLKFEFMLDNMLMQFYAAATTSTS